MTAKLDRLRATLAEMRSVLVAYSGGLDSALVLKVATDLLGDDAVGLTAVGPALAPSELEDAQRIARAMGARHLLVSSSEIDDPRYVANPSNRCFFCKSELYRITAAKQAELGLAFVANGTNIDDLSDHRPGLDAAREAGVRTPLVEAAFRKEDVREAARALGMDVWDKPASACLASRIPYGTPVTRERLAQVAALEGAVRALGLRQVRVRHHGELARVEVATDELPGAFSVREAIVARGREAGFTFVTLDLAGYRMGSLNELLRVLPHYPTRG